MKPSRLATRAIEGVGWNYVGALTRIVATFVSQLVLARLLGPEVFGRFGYAFLTVSVLALIVDMGLQSALVQVDKLDAQVLSTACGRLLAAGAAAAIGVFLLADPIAAFVFEAPQVAPVLRAMAPTLLVGALNAAAAATLTRELEFRTLQLSAIASYVIGYMVVGIGCAIAGFGVWSLVLAWHTQTVLSCIILVTRSGYSLAPSNPLRRLPVDRYATTVMTSHVATWVIDNGPHAAVGRWMGAATLGQFSVAYNLVRVPADQLVRNVQSVLHSLASRAQNNNAGLRRAYLTVTCGIALIAFPLFGFVAWMAEPVVRVLLGSPWANAATVLTPLSLVMAMHAVEAMAGPTLGGRGEPGVELRVKLVMLLVAIPVLLVCSRWSLAAVGWGLAVVVLVRWLWMNWAVTSRLGIDVSEFLRTMGGPLILAAVAVGVPALVSARLAADATPPMPGWLLVACAVPAFVVILALTAVFPRLVLGPYVLSLLSGLFDKRPGWARNAALRRIASSAARAHGEARWAHQGASTR